MRDCSLQQLLVVVCIIILSALLFYWIYLKRRNQLIVKKLSESELSSGESFTTEEFDVKQGGVLNFHVSDISDLDQFFGAGDGLSFEPTSYNLYGGEDPPQNQPQGDGQVANAAAAAHAAQNNQDLVAPALYPLTLHETIERSVKGIVENPDPVLTFSAMVPEAHAIQDNSKKQINIFCQLFAESDPANHIHWWNQEDNTCWISSYMNMFSLLLMGTDFGIAPINPNVNLYDSKKLREVINMGSVHTYQPVRIIYEKTFAVLENSFINNNVIVLNDDRLGLYTDYYKDVNHHDDFIPVNIPQPEAAPDHGRQGVSIYYMKYFVKSAYVGFVINLGDYHYITAVVVDGTYVFEVNGGHRDIGGVDVRKRSQIEAAAYKLWLWPTVNSYVEYLTKSKTKNDIFIEIVAIKLGKDQRYALDTKLDPYLGPQVVYTSLYNRDRAITKSFFKWIVYFILSNPNYLKKIGFENIDDWNNDMNNPDPNKRAYIKSDNNQTKYMKILTNASFNSPSYLFEHKLSDLLVNFERWDHNDNKQVQTITELKRDFDNIVPSFNVFKSNGQLVNQMKGIVDEVLRMLQVFPDNPEIKDGNEFHKTLILLFPYLIDQLFLFSDNKLIDEVVNNRPRPNPPGPDGAPPPPAPPSNAITPQLTLVKNEVVARLTNTLNMLNALRGITQNILAAQPVPNDFARSVQNVLTETHTYVHNFKIWYTAAKYLENTAQAPAQPPNQATTHFTAFQGQISFVRSQLERIQGLLVQHQDIAQTIALMAPALDNVINEINVINARLNAIVVDQTKVIPEPAVPENYKRIPNIGGDPPSVERLTATKNALGVAEQYFAANAATLQGIQEHKPERQSVENLLEILKNCSRMYGTLYADCNKLAGNLLYISQKLDLHPLVNANNNARQQYADARAQYEAANQGFRARAARLARMIGDHMMNFRNGNLIDPNEPVEPNLEDYEAVITESFKSLLASIKEISEVLTSLSNEINRRQEGNELQQMSAYLNAVLGKVNVGVRIVANEYGLTPEDHFDKFARNRIFNEMFADHRIVSLDVLRYFNPRLMIETLPTEALRMEFLFFVKDILTSFHTRFYPIDLPPREQFYYNLIVRDFWAIYNDPNYRDILNLEHDTLVSPPPIH